jgi:hypothetical protein
MQDSVSISTGFKRDGSPGFFIKLQGRDCELNVAVSEKDLKALRQVGGARWLDRKSLLAGECLGAPAYWSCEDGILSVLVGSDDETWQAGIFLPDWIIVDLLAEIESALNAEKGL